MLALPVGEVGDMSLNWILGWVGAILEAPRLEQSGMFKLVILLLLLCLPKSNDP